MAAFNVKSLLACAIAYTAAADKYSVVVGFLSQSPIQMMVMDRTSGVLTDQSNYSAFANSAWMTTDETGGLLYVANHFGSGGGVSVYNVTGSQDGALSLSNITFAGTEPNADPVHLFYLHGALYSVSYGDASFNTWAAYPNGSLTRSLVRVNACPNAHQIVLIPSKYYAPQRSYSVIVPCLGNNRILVDTAEAGCTGMAGSVCSRGEDGVSRDGSGPRHVVPHPTLPLVYVINELDSSVAVWTYDPVDPMLSRPTYQSSLPPGIAGAGDKTVWAGAEIALHPNGKYLYVSNRALTTVNGTNSSIGCFAVASDGSLSPLGWYTGGGDVQFPRHFSITPDGAWMLVANQKGQSITVFAIAADGSLSKTGTYPTLGAGPAFVQVLRVPVYPKPQPPADGAGRVGVGLDSGLLLSVVLGMTMMLVGQWSGAAE